MLSTICTSLKNKVVKYFPPELQLQLMQPSPPSASSQHPECSEFSVTKKKDMLAQRDNTEASPLSIVPGSLSLSEQFIPTYLEELIEVWNL